MKKKKKKDYWQSASMEDERKEEKIQPLRIGKKKWSKHEVKRFDCLASSLGGLG